MICYALKRFQPESTLETTEGPRLSLPGALKCVTMDARTNEVDKDGDGVRNLVSGCHGILVFILSECGKMGVSNN